MVTSIFLPFVIDNSKLRRDVHTFVASLPGFVRFEGGEAWIKDASLGCMAYFANERYASDADQSIRNRRFGSKRVGGFLTKIYTSPIADASDADNFDAAVIAYRHTPSATHYNQLTNAMLRYQATHPINAEYTQR